VPNPAISGQYAQTVDRTIREWQGALNATGKSSISANTMNDIRSSLRDSFSQWSKGQGIGDLEKNYRAASRAEFVASAKDLVPQLISRFGKESQANQIMQELGKDAATVKPMIAKELKNHFANLTAKEVPGEFDRLEKLLVNSGMMQPKELFGLRGQVENIRRVSAGESLEKAGTRIRNIFLKAVGSASAAKAVSEIGAD